MNRSKLIFLIVAPSILMGSIDATIVTVALPTLQDELHASLALAAWTLTAYALAQTIILPLSGKIVDERGRKAIFLAAVILFITGSVGAGLAPNIYVLIAFRIIQGVGGGAFFPCAVGIVSQAMGGRSATSIGLLTSLWPMGAILGPNFGGFIIGHLAWRWIFFVNVPIGVAILGAGLLWLPTDRPILEKRPIDYSGAGVFAVAVFAVLFGMTQLANHPDDLGSPVAWGSILTGMVVLAVFIRHESRTSDPMIDLELIKSRPLLAANIYGFFYGAAIYGGLIAFIPYFAIEGYGMSAAQSGAIATPRAIGSACASTVSSLLMARMGYRLLMSGGVLVVVVSLFVLGAHYHHAVILGAGIPDALLLSALMAVVGIGMGTSGPSIQNAGLELVPDKVAAVAGLRNMFINTGAVMGTAGYTLALSRFSDKGDGLAHIFQAVALLLVLLIPVGWLVPDGRRLAPLNVIASEPA